MARQTVLATIVVICLLALALLPSQVAAEQLIGSTFPSDNYFVMEGETASFTVELMPDVPSSEAIVQWYKGNNPVGDNSLTYSYTPGFDEAGTYKVTVFVVYNGTSDSHDWTLTVMDVKEKFRIVSTSPFGDIVMDEGEKEVFTVMVDNPAGDILNYRWFVDTQYYLGLNRSTFVFEPGLDDHGDRTIRVMVESQDNTEEHEWDVKVEDTLEVMPAGEVEVHEGRSVEFKVLSPEMTDPEVIWYLDGSVGNVGTGRTFTYSPDHNSAGSHTLTMNTSRGLGHEWKIKVVNVNRPPSVEGGKVRKATVGEAASFEGVPSDPDNDIATHEWDFNGDGTFDYTSDQHETTTHTYTKAGVHLATYKVTDSEGRTAVTVYQYVVSEPATLSGWHIASILIGVIVALMLVWVLYDKHKERVKARAESKRIAEVPTRLDTRARPRRREELPLFEDIIEDEKPAEEMVMVPYASKMADRDMEAEGAADDTEIHVGEKETVDGVAPTAADLEKVGEEFSEDERQEIDDILSTLTAKALGKADLKSKKASAEVGAGDTDTEIGIGPAPRRPKKKKGKKRSKKKLVKEEDKAGTSKGADSDIDAEQTDVDLIMKDLIDKGLAERRPKRKR